MIPSQTIWSALSHERRFYDHHGVILFIQAKMTADQESPDLLMETVCAQRMTEAIAFLLGDNNFRYGKMMQELANAYGAGQMNIPIRSQTCINGC